MLKTIAITAAAIAALALVLPIANPSVFGVGARMGVGGGHFGGSHGVGSFGGSSHVIVGHAYGHHFVYRGHSCYYIINQFSQYQLYCPGRGIVS
jgi:hypothetical protein